MRASRGGYKPYAMDNLGSMADAEAPRERPYTLAEELLGWSPEQPAIRHGDINVMTDGTPAEALERQEREGWTAAGRSDLAPFELSMPLDWSVSPYGDANWAFQLHAWRMIDAYVLTFEKNGE